MKPDDSNPYQPPAARVADVDRAASVEDAADDPVPATSRPAAISIAMWLLWTSIAIEVLDKLFDAYEGLQTSRIVVVASTVTLVMLGAVCVLIFMIGRRRNWARITYALLFSLGMIFHFANWKGALDSPPRELIAIVLQSGLQLAAVILLFQRVANQWFRSRRSPQ